MYMTQELFINFLNDQSQSTEFGRIAKDETAFPVQLELRESGLGHTVTSQRKSKITTLTSLPRKELALILIIELLLAQDECFLVKVLSLFSGLTL